MIHIDKVTKYYDQVCAVDSLCLDISRGEVLGLLGPNGAGKTTTLRMLTGFLLPTSGNITVKDLDIVNSPIEIRKLMGYLPESAPLYKDMLVFDYLEFIASVRGLKGDKKLQRISFLADICGISSVMHKTLNELSKGFNQRVGLAHAMMSDPEILVLDEPTSGLDPNQIVEIREIIKEIGKEKTVILSTHILSEAEAACDRIVIIDKGKIALDGKTSELRKEAGTEKIAAASVKCTDIESLKDRLKKIERVIDIEVSEAKKPVYELRIKCSEDVREKIYLEIKETDSILLELYMQKQSLENLFRKITT